MSVAACNVTMSTGSKCRNGSPHIIWLCAGYEFRVAAVCWNNLRCRVDPVGVRISTPDVPPPSVTLSREDQLRALEFLMGECSVLYVPYCQQQVIDRQLRRIPPWRLQDIAIPSLEQNWFFEEKISIMDMPDTETPEQSRDLIEWLGTDDAETDAEKDSDDKSSSSAFKVRPSP